MSERILCAAIWYKGRVPISGFRHADCINLIQTLIPDHDPDRLGRENQGFLTSRNRFVDRSEGYRIARDAGQLIIIHDDTPILTSEDLY